MSHVGSRFRANSMSATRVFRRLLAVIAATAVLLACEGPGQVSQSSRRSDAGVQGRLVVPLTDSGVVASMAIAALQNTTKQGPPLRVYRYLRQPDGTLVTLMTTDPRMLGGGGVVWVPREGTAIVLLRYE